MANISTTLKNELLKILKHDYEECQFFLAATNLLMNKIKDVSEMLQNENNDFNALRDTIGETSLFISNAEKRLYEVEECYTKMVEALSKEKQ